MILYKMKETVPMLMSETGDLARTDMENAEVLNYFFASVFTSKRSRHTIQFTASKGTDWENEILPPIVDKVQDCLRNLEVHKSIGPHEVQPQVLSEVADEVTKPLSIISEKQWQAGEVPSDWQRGNITPTFNTGKKEDPGN